MLADCKEFYRRNLRRYFGPPKGCSAEALKKVEEVLGHQLPAVYRDYLLWMGADYDGAFRGTDWFAKDVVQNTEYVPELLRENSLVWPLPDAFVSFFCHQGYICAWFDLEDVNEDPQVWLFSEGSSPCPECKGTFSSFLLLELERVAAIGSALF